MEKHTLGPWLVHENKRTINVFAPDYSNRTIATVPIPQFVHSVSAAPNARLIAAAPDLLAALKGIEGQRQLNAERLLSALHLWDAVREAIAKAQG